VFVNATALGFDEMKEVIIVLTIGSLSYLTSELFMRYAVAECKKVEFRVKFCREFVNGR